MGKKIKAAAKAKPNPKPPAKGNASIRPALQQRSQDKRDRLIKAGISLFAQKGYEQTRVTDLAEAAEISIGVFYQRFKDKRGFFDALEVDFVERGKKNWDRYFEIADPNASARQTFESLVRSLAKLITRNIGFQRALLSVGHHNKDVVSSATALDLYGAEKLGHFLIKRKFTTKAKLRPNQVYFALSIVTKSLTVMALNNAGPFYAQDDETIIELALLLEAYFGTSK